MMKRVMTYWRRVLSTCLAVVLMMTAATNGGEATTLPRGVAMLMESSDLASLERAIMLMTNSMMPGAGQSGDTQGFDQAFRAIQNSGQMPSMVNPLIQQFFRLPGVAIDVELVARPASDMSAFLRDSSIRSLSPRFLSAMPGNLSVALALSGGEEVKRLLATLLRDARADIASSDCTESIWSMRPRSGMSLLPLRETEQGWQYLIREIPPPLPVLLDALAVAMG